MVSSSVVVGGITSNNNTWKNSWPYGVISRSSVPTGYISFTCQYQQGAVLQEWRKRRHHTQLGHQERLLSTSIGLAMREGNQRSQAGAGPLVSTSHLQACAMGHSESHSGLAVKTAPRPRIWHAISMSPFVNGKSCLCSVYLVFKLCKFIVSSLYDLCQPDVSYAISQFFYNPRILELE